MTETTDIEKLSSGPTPAPLSSGPSPGPWIEEEWSIFAAGVGAISDVDPIANVIPWPDIDEPDDFYLAGQREANANRKLIAAAPDMLTALIAAKDGLLLALQHLACDPCQLTETREIVRAALLKALGQNNQTEP